MKRMLLLVAGLIIVGGVFYFLNADRVLALDQTGCLACHGNENFTKPGENGQPISLYVNKDAVDSGAHRYIDCTFCHTTDPHSVQTPLNKLSLAQKCGTCHQYEYEQHLDSVHGQQLLKGNQDVATCVDCHSPTSNPHSVIRVLEYNAPAYKKNIAQTCAKCHDNQKLMADYGIVERVYESYMRSFHGKALQLGTYAEGELQTATCTNCHGTHDIKSASDPSSPVAGLQNLAVTCEECHPGAGVTFAAGFLGHREASRTYIPVVHYTENFFTILYYTVIAFGVIIVAAAFIRFTIRRWKE